MPRYVLPGSACISSALLAASLAIPSTATAAVEILFSRFAPPQDIINTQIVEPWAKRVEEVTSGRVKIKFSPTSLAAPQQQWEMVTQGVADAGYLFNGFAQNRLLLPQLAHLPFLSPSAESTAVALWRTHEQFFSAKGEYKDVHLLGVLVGPSGQFYSLTDTPLDSAAKLSRLKIWGLPGVPARELDKLGASVVPGPAVRIHEIVSKGVVDAFAGIGPYHVDAYNAAPFAKSVTMVPGGMSAPSFSIIMNKDKWASIPREDQALIMKVSGEELARASAVYDKANLESLAKMEKSGTRRIDASPEFLAELQSKWAFLEEEWVASAAKRDVDGKAALAYFRKQIKAPDAPRKVSMVAQRLKQALQAALFVCLFAIMAVTTIDVICRYFLSWPLRGAFEIVTLLLAASTFLALPLVSQAGEHISVDIVRPFLKGRFLFMQKVAIDLISGGVLAAMSYQMWRQAGQLADGGQITGFLELPLAPLAYLMSIMAGLSLAVYLIRIGNQLRRVTTADTLASGPGPSDPAA